MKTLFFILIQICLSIICNGQAFVNIPDTNFLKALIKNKVDINNNNKIEQEEASKITLLYLKDSFIKDLTGIEFFDSLQELNCSFNQIKSLNLSKNIALEYLYGDENDLDEIDIRNNKLLLHVHCARNRITKIDVSQNLELVHLDCNNNPIDSLDFSKNLKLRKLEAYDNLIRKLDLTQNSDLFNVVVKNNPYLKQICITKKHLNLTVEAFQDWVKDENATWNSNCITGIEEGLALLKTKKVERIYNSLGQEIKIENAQNGLFIFQYSDGSVKKMFLD